MIEKCIVLLQYLLCNEFLLWKVVTRSFRCRHIKIKHGCILKSIVDNPSKSYGRVFDHNKKPTSGSSYEIYTINLTHHDVKSIYYFLFIYFKQQFYNIVLNNCSEIKSESITLNSN